MSARILVVDDNPDLVWAVEFCLRDAGYEVVVAHNGRNGLAQAHAQRPDLVVLDILMPDMNGIELCAAIRQDPTLASVPVLFLSERSAVDDRVAGFEIGADDYLAKPFDLRELKARVRALLRRGAPAPAPAPNRTLRVGPVTLDLDVCSATVGERVAQLTPAEFELLRYLMEHPGRTFSSQHLVEHVWGYASDAADPSLARWHIKNLRLKLEEQPDQPKLIRTVGRHGYMLERRIV